jgi:hypothetical protein
MRETHADSREADAGDEGRHESHSDAIARLDRELVEEHCPAQVGAVRPAGVGGIGNRGGGEVHAERVLPDVSPGRFAWRLLVNKFAGAEEVTLQIEVLYSGVGGLFSRAEVVGRAVMAVVICIAVEAGKESSLSEAASDDGTDAIGIIGAVNGSGTAGGGGYILADLSRAGETGRDMGGMHKLGGVIEVAACVDDGQAEKQPDGDGKGEFNQRRAADA